MHLGVIRQVGLAFGTEPMLCVEGAGIAARLEVR
jgi:hypothetical protein